jgi:hypothetical protein
MAENFRMLSVVVIASVFAYVEAGHSEQWKTLGVLSYTSSGVVLTRQGCCDSTMSNAEIPTFPILPPATNFDLPAGHARPAVFTHL